MNKLLPKKFSWIKPGIKCDYHAFIDGPPTEFNLTVETEPELLSGHKWVTWLIGKCGCVACEALSKEAEYVPDRTFRF